MTTSIKRNFLAKEILTEARSSDRPTAREMFTALADDHKFYELHGDRKYGDDGAMCGGIGQINGQAVSFVGTQKGHDVEENITANFGSPHAEGYRKAVRLFKQAEKFNRPIITLINTAGAFCDIEAEDRGIGESIAKSIQTLASLKVPSIAILMGEGGSGGALALASTNQVWMLEDAMYSILSPEGFASILWRDASRRDEACEVMKMTAYDLLENEVIDKMIPVFEGEEHLSWQTIIQNIRLELENQLSAWQAIDREVLVQERYDRFRKF
ncbi:MULTISPECIES: acetyl-CoA carboxylase carboxyltransferase subunit alpha [Aerococcus]|uniref:acetyl-CoA carboxytransferase n=1 Tax=Aerococcus mictus TaxID=2976810 RepID=A0ABZ2EAL4_9LACT|nr:MULTISPECIES: carboxyltransferase subunit alpha [Aerococcus]MDK6597574.1 carboxyltransferase subunit alpha [Aerococcus urinae]MDK7302826.1 carboxyltransferase subunit alpha [Aerococcus urinae]MDL5174937.1 carboxyltransferase subunit alpha [Aerococcus mictus]RAV71374.1 acetyl-CoA carboxylase carboxyl transferase subunit alpha [Aerococcus urinae]RAW05268.1 acetyl-CoA carboxylase carboxyl transferase subunit alpha [Aerococcus urinae]